MAGPVRAFLTNSGTEAVEGALKLARAATGRQYVISFYGAFHGRSYGSVSLTASKAKYHAGFGPLLPGVLHAPYGYCHRCPLNLRFPDCGLATVDWLTDTLFRYEVDPGEVAAVFVEPIQGEGGYITPPPGWLAKLKALCERHGILLVADEVQSGMGRTGRMWAIEHTGVEPDVLIAAKGIASGLPLGAFMARDELWRWPKGAHGSTYGGSPVPCAAGLATLEVLRDEKLLANATAQGELLLEGLERLRAPLRLAGRGRPRGRPDARGRVPHREAGRGGPAGLLPPRPAGPGGRRERRPPVAPPGRHRRPVPHRPAPVHRGRRGGRR